MNHTRPPGRQPERGATASKSVRIPLTPDELAWLDERRGDAPRATWMRERALTPPATGLTREAIEPLRFFLDVYLRDCGKRWEVPWESITLRDLTDHMDDRPAIMGPLLRLAILLNLPSGEPDEDES